MKICETCEQKDICTRNTPCAHYKEFVKRAKALGMQVWEWEQFEWEWQQVTDKLKKYFGGGNKDGIIHKNSH